MKYIYDWSISAANMTTVKGREQKVKYIYNWSYQAATMATVKVQEPRIVSE